jgi:hypothetical protein
MQKILVSVLAAFLCSTLITSCDFIKNKKSKRTFYNTVSGWDIIHVPIIEPYKASSIDNGLNWLLNRKENGSVSISQFGVSKSLIYGSGVNRKWFLYDTQSDLYAEYTSKEKLFSCLQSLNITINPIAKCKNYFDSLADGKKCYWFPKEGQKYPAYANLAPKNINAVSVYEKSKGDFDFTIASNIEAENTSIYFFKLKFNKKDNDSLYISINHSEPIFIKDSLIIPSFINEKQFEIILYIPYQIAQDKGIKEEKRIRKIKTVIIKSDKYIFYGD